MRSSHRKIQQENILFQLTLHFLQASSDICRGVYQVHHVRPQFCWRLLTCPKLCKKILSMYIVMVNLKIGSVDQKF